MKREGISASAVAFNIGLLAMSAGASAAPQNYAVYSVALQAVQAPNTAPAYAPGANGSQQSAPYPASAANPPVPVQVGGGADTGPNHNGYGYANGSAFARAEAGALKAAAHAEAQAVAQPATNVGASVNVRAVAEFVDRVTFTAAAGQYLPQNVLLVSGNLLLEGSMSTVGGYGKVSVGGTGVGYNSSSEWWGETSGMTKSGSGVYSTWVPGSPVSIPFSFSVYSGQSSELDYWLTVIASAGASYGACEASGGLCNVVQQATRTVDIDYSHTLAWGGVTVTDMYGNAVDFTASSISGFDYAQAYTPAVPVPAAAWLFGSGLAGLVMTARRRRSA